MDIDTVIAWALRTTNTNKYAGRNVIDSATLDHMSSAEINAACWRVTLENQGGGIVVPRDDSPPNAYGK